MSSHYLTSIYLQGNVVMCYDIPCYQATQRNLSALCHVADPTGTAIFTFDYHYHIQAYVLSTLKGYNTVII